MILWCQYLCIIEVMVPKNERQLISHAIPSKAQFVFGHAFDKNLGAVLRFDICAIELIFLVRKFLKKNTNTNSS